MQRRAFRMWQRDAPSNSSNPIQTRDPRFVEPNPGPGSPGGNLCDSLPVDDFLCRFQTFYGTAAPDECCWLVQALARHSLASSQACSALQATRR